MLDKIEYTELEEALIEATLKDEKFESDSWSNEELNNIRRRIKSVYLDFQDYTCSYCKQRFHSKNGKIWDIEHIIPRSFAPNFMFEPLNLCVACVDCNIAKSSKVVTSSKAKVKYPKSSEKYLIVHPHFDKYEENILIIKEGLYYVALKKKGEKTIEVCHLNRFYEFANFGSSVQEDEQIFLLSEQLRNCKDELVKKKLRKFIASLAIKGSV